jgi:hypothetical protein
LAEELGVKPSRQTVALCEQMRADRFGQPPFSDREGYALSQTVVASLVSALDRLKQLCTVLADIQQQVRQEIRTVESTLHHRR